MQRRKFLKLLGLGGSMGTLAGTGAAEALASGGAGIARNPEAVGVLHDSTLCTGCRECEKACARVNGRTASQPPYDDLSILESRRRPTVQSYTVVNAYEGPNGPVFRKWQCNHCLEPACASACFVKAFSKTPEGPVVYNPKLCVGCRYCMIACPFTTPAYDYERALNPLVHKCTLCAPRLAEGKIPGCVEACPNGALVFGKRIELLKLARRRILNAPDLYEDHIYGEHEAGGSSWLYLSPVPHRELGQPELDDVSIPELTSGALGAVPLIAALWPVLLTGAWAISKRNAAVAKEEREQAVREAVRGAVAETEAKAAAQHEKALQKALKDKEAELKKMSAEKEDK